MKRQLIPICSALLLGISAMAQNSGNAPASAGKPGMTLTTPAFSDGGEIPSKYTQRVLNPESPKLEWTHAPSGVVSFVLHMHDPDVAKQKTTEDQLHWMVIN